MGIELRPITRDQAKDFVREHHRHHGAPVGDLWRHAVHDDSGLIVGVAVVGRPVARGLDDGLSVEVTRLCTLGTPNADSMLYGAARRAADAKGYRRGLTYILASEWDRFVTDAGEPCEETDIGARRIGGAGARAAGYRFLWRVDGRSWDCPSRPRTDKHPTEDKVALGWGAWGALSEDGGAS
ncbi:XF1762 family protein [Aquabacter sp. CN5-332]|uniref:XF1762 family protein n=1 Tax=Aquabacter sp. CN5-332 TaxID=3156608 RepID=UPI0032B4C9AD